MHGGVPGPDPGSGWLPPQTGGPASSAGMILLIVLIAAVGILIAVPALIDARPAGFLIGGALLVLDGVLIRAQLGRRTSPGDEEAEQTPGEG